MGKRKRHQAPAGENAAPAVVVVVEEKDKLMPQVLNRLRQ